MADWLIYGAGGYTGRMIAAGAVRRGLRPILAGRTESKLRALAEQLNCPWRSFDLLHCAGQLAGVRLVLNCAGPFSQTVAPLITECLAAGTHYLDITGEIDVLESAASLGAKAENAGVLLLPAVGFDVVPSDCLAALVARKLPSAIRLELAFSVTEPLSPGTARTIWENLPRGGRVRRAGQIVRVPTAWKSQRIPFPGQPRWAMTVPWGDVATAYYSTGIPEIEVYMAAPRLLITVAKAGRWFWPLLRWRPLSAAGDWLISKCVRGASPCQREVSRAWFWARASDGVRAVQATLGTPGGYALTVVTALDCVTRVLAAECPRGFRTPAQFLGADYILSVPGVDLSGDAL